MWRRSQNGLDSGSDDDDEMTMRAANTMVPMEKGLVTQAIFSPYNFSDIGSKVGKQMLNSHIVRQMESCGFDRMTYIQQHSIPVILEGRDTLLRSYTGSGKTLCFVVPILSMLADMKQNQGLTRADGTVAVIVSPTRELCAQTFEITQKLSKNSPYIVSTALSGGEKRKSEKARLRKGVTVLMGTPGRLRDHLESTASFHAPKLRMLVLDEADRLLDLGFERVLRTIYDELVANVRKTSDKEIAKEVLRDLLAQQKKEKGGSTVSFDDSGSDGLSSDSSDEDDDDELVLNVKGRMKVPTNKDFKASEKLAKLEKLNKTLAIEFDKKNEETEQDNNDEFSSSAFQKKIVSVQPKNKKEKLQDIQVVLVSATLSPAVSRLAEFCLRGRPAWVALQQKKGNQPPEAIVTSNAKELVATLEKNAEGGDVQGDEGSLDALEKRMAAIPAHLDQKVLQVSLKTRLVALLAVLLQHAIKGKVVVFLSSCQSVEFHHAIFQDIRWPNRMDSRAVGEEYQGVKELLNAASDEVNRQAVSEFLENEDDGYGALKHGGWKSQKRQDKKRQQRNENGEDGDHLMDVLEERQKEVKQGDVGGRILEGINLFKLHGKLEREDRLGYLTDFTKCSNGVLFTSDVAARGLNLPHVNAVIQLDPPQQAEEYAHRVGRTARLDQSGSSYLFLTEPELGFNQALIHRGVNCKPISELGLFANFTNQLAPMHLSGIRSLPQFLGGWIARYISGRIELLRLSREGFLSARRAYSTYSKELKPFFNPSSLHLGHLAAAFGLKETPAQIAEFAKRARDKEAALQSQEHQRTRRGDLMRKGGKGNFNDEFESAFDDDLKKTIVGGDLKSKKDKLRDTSSKFKSHDKNTKRPGALSRASNSKATRLPFKHHTASAKPQPELATVSRVEPASGNSGFSVDDVVQQALRAVSNDTIKLATPFGGMKRKREGEESFYDKQKKQKRARLNEEHKVSRGERAAERAGEPSFVPTGRKDILMSGGSRDDRKKRIPSTSGDQLKKTSPVEKVTKVSYSEFDD